MQRYSTIVLLLLLLPFAATAKKKKKKKWHTQDIVTISDSLLRAKMGDSLFAYCRFDNTSYYVYGGRKEKYYLELLPTKKLTKDFQQAHIIYHFSMPWGECPQYDTVSGVINTELVKTDTTFSFVSEPDLSFIPKAAAARQPCKLITEAEAINLAIADTLVRGVNPPYAVLVYQAQTQKFLWLVFSLIWDERNFSNEEEAKKDLVIVDAVSGLVLEHKKVPYTRHISTTY